jgi:ferredoxin
VSPLNKLKEDIAKELDALECVLGWEQGFDPLHTAPLYCRSRDDLDRLLWTPLSVHNLVSYLPALKGRKVGIVVKGCDSRSLIQLLQEGLIQREELVIFGMPCRGVVNVAKLRAKLGNVALKDITFQDGTIVVDTAEGSQEVALEEMLATKCLSCQHPTPLIYDYLASDPIPPDRPADLADQEVEEIEAMDVRDRCAYWEVQLDRCIRCYACRNACPLCVCQDSCAAESRDPHWLSLSSGIGEKVMWQMIHALHVAGRCTDCGECERACPMDIPIQRIRRKMNKDIKELFDYEAGMNVDDTPPLYTFKVEEPTIKEKHW